MERLNNPFQIKTLYSSQLAIFLLLLLNCSIEFAFEPRMFEIGKPASLLANILVLGALIGCVAMGYSRRWKPKREIAPALSGRNPE